MPGVLAYVFACAFACTQAAAQGLTAATVPSPERALALAPTTTTAPASTPTAEERAWIDDAAPVLRAGTAAGLKIAVVVQPQPNDGEAPVSSAWVEGECLLVLTLRGAGDPLTGRAGTGLPDGILREAVVAHELAHCVRQAAGAWHRLPAEMSSGMPSGTPGAAEVPADTQRLAALRAEMHATRREEGYADLSALAWIAERHPARYVAVHAWLSTLRADVPFDGAHHDTRAWLALAGDPSVFRAAGSDTPWVRAVPVWHAGLRGR